MITEDYRYLWNMAAKMVVRRCDGDHGGLHFERERSIFILKSGAKIIFLFSGVNAPK